MKDKYGLLLFTDTHSLCYEITTEDLYQDLSAEMSLFDFADYPREHFLQSTANPKVLRKMTYETRGIPITELMGQSVFDPKCALFFTRKTANPLKKKVAKGIAKHIAKREIRHEHYKPCLFQREIIFS